MPEVTFKIHRQRLVKYVTIIWLIVTLGVPGLVLMAMGLRRAIGQWVRSLEYRLSDDALCVSGCIQLWGCVLYRYEKRIPLSKITDIKLVQGPILNAMDLWHIHIQTAGTGQLAPEAVLRGIEDPQEVQQQILQAAGR